MDISTIPIVTVSYNAPDLIFNLLSSIRQFYANPIYVIDGSDADNATKVNEVSRAFDNVHFHGFDYNIHHGPGMAWAIQNLPFSGPVLFIDSDMRATENGFIEDLYGHLEPHIYGVGYVIYVNRDGFTITEGIDDSSVRYLHPALMLCNIEVMREWPMPIKHGAPMTDTMVRLHDEGRSDLLLNIEWVGEVADNLIESPRFLLHEMRGTVKRTGSYNLDEWMQEVISKRQQQLETSNVTNQTTSLDMGCGSNPRNIFNAQIVYGIDVREDLDKNIVKADLILDKIPFNDDFFDYVTAHDFFEHIPRLIYCPDRKLPFVDLMSEIWRVLKPNGKLYSSTPAFPHAAAFWDPTHVNFITEQTFPLYFDSVNNWGSIYGFNGGFQIESQIWNGPHLVSILVKV